MLTYRSAARSPDEAGTGTEERLKLGLSSTVAAVGARRRAARKGLFWRGAVPVCKG